MRSEHTFHHRIKSPDHTTKPDFQGVRGGKLTEEFMRQTALNSTRKKVMVEEREREWLSKKNVRVLWGWGKGKKCRPWGGELKKQVKTSSGKRKWVGNH